MTELSIGQACSTYLKQWHCEKDINKQKKLAERVVQKVLFKNTRLDFFIKKKVSQILNVCIFQSFYLGFITLF